MILSSQEQTFILSKVVDAVAHCHNRGVIHRDIKLENILINIDHDRRIKDIRLADFGMATSNTKIV